MSAVLELPLENQIIKIEPLVIESVPVVIKGNFAEVEALIKQDVADKMLLVTPETTKTGKDQAAEFRRNAKNLAANWKLHKEYLTQGVLDADQDVKRICKVWDDGAKEISNQVDKIEQETKDTCTILLLAFRNACWDELGVETDYRKASIDDLVKLGSLTPKGELTKGAKAEVENRCKLDLAQQEKIASRLMDLENRCLKAEINPPLSRASVASFLHSEDAHFYTLLDNLVNAEIERKAEAERLMKARLEAENQRKLDEALKAQQLEANRIATEAARKEAAERQAEGIRRAQELKAQEEAQKPVEQPAPPQNDYPGEQIVAQVDAGMLVNFNVEVMVAHKYTFRSKLNTDHGKIKAHFRDKVIATGVDPGCITEVFVGWLQ